MTSFLVVLIAMSLLVGLAEGTTLTSWGHACIVMVSTPVIVVISMKLGYGIWEIAGHTVLAIGSISVGYLFSAFVTHGPPARPRDEHKRLAKN